MSELIETDVLILGCGVAGGTVALRLADAGMPVTLVTRAADPNDTNTHLGPGRHHLSRVSKILPELLVADILRAGAGHSSHQAASHSGRRRSRAGGEHPAGSRWRGVRPCPRVGNYRWRSRAGIRCPASSTPRMPLAKPSVKRWCGRSRRIPTSPCSPGIPPSTC